MMYISSHLLIATAAISSVVALPLQEQGQIYSRREVKHVANQARADAVQEAFVHAWDGYKKYAFPNDELLPVSNGFGNSRNGWGASAVDALSTALVMRNKEIVQEIVDFVPTIDFTHTNTTASLFETTIRYLGGMLSGYDLLKGPLRGLVKKGSNVNALLSQSIKLAQTLQFAFNTSTGIPYNSLNINDQSFSGDAVNNIAQFGTLVLEWTHLSDLTSNPIYAKLSQKAETYILSPKPATSEPFPGLVGSNVDINTGLFIDASGGWQGGDDSFYEYLIKMYIYDPSRFASYKDRWSTAVDSTIQNLASHPKPRPDITFLAEFKGKDLVLTSQHLACFAGGNIILGGRVLNRQDYIDFGLKLVDGCRDTYTATATHIGPEIFAWDQEGVPDDQRAFFEKSGFYIKDATYDLRPEVIESYYYAYRVTGDSKYQDWAWEAFVAINASTRTDSGFSSLADVNAAGGGQKTDLQESFLFAEVMKYSYLIQAEDDIWQAERNGVNQWVYNTEAHPIRVAGRPI